MNNIKCKKGDIQVLVNPATKQCEWINPSNINIYIGKVEVDEKGNKRVISGTPKPLGTYLSEKEEEIQTLKNEVKTLTADYLKLQDEVLKGQSENLSLFNKMNNAIDTLLKKVNRLENEVDTLLSINSK